MLLIALHELGVDQRHDGALPVLADLRGRFAEAHETHLFVVVGGVQLQRLSDLILFAEACLDLRLKLLLQAFFDLQVVVLDEVGQLENAEILSFLRLQQWAHIADGADRVEALRLTDACIVLPEVEIVDLLNIHELPPVGLDCDVLLRCHARAFPDDKTRFFILGRAMSLIFELLLLGFGFSLLQQHQFQVHLSVHFFELPLLALLMLLGFHSVAEHLQHLETLF